MRRLVIAALARGVNVPTGYVRLGRRVVNPNAGYGSQRGHPRPVQADTRAARAARTAGDRPLIVVGLLVCLAFWGAVFLGIVAAV